MAGPFERRINFDRSRSVDIADDPMEDDPLADETASDKRVPKRSLADQFKTNEPAPEESESDTDEAEIFESPARIVIIDKAPDRNIEGDEDELADDPPSDPILERRAPKIDLGLAGKAIDDEATDGEDD